MISKLSRQLGRAVNAAVDELNQLPEIRRVAPFQFRISIRVGTGKIRAEHRAKIPETLLAVVRQILDKHLKTHLPAHYVDGSVRETAEHDYYPHSSEQLKHSSYFVFKLKRPDVKSWKPDAKDYPPGTSAGMLY